MIELLSFCTATFGSGPKGEAPAFYVRFWHKADIPSCTAHVRFRG